jgi:hypothetical protein
MSGKVTPFVFHIDLTFAVLSFQIPSGYEVKADPESNICYYINVFTGVRWFSAEDAKGKVYFYEENGNESCWRLPNVSQSIQDTTPPPTTTLRTPSKACVKRPLTGSTRRISEQLMVDVGGGVEEEEQKKGGEAASKSKTINSHSKLNKTEMLERKFTLPVSTANITIGNVSIVVIKQGPLHRTKLVEKGKRQRKNWSNCHAVLTDTFLLFFKDAKCFASMQNASSSWGDHKQPDHCIDLKGAKISWCTAGDKSKRSHVFEVTTLLSLTMLMQDDSLQVAAEWFEEVRQVVEAIKEGTKLIPTTAAGSIRRSKGGGAGGTTITQKQEEVVSGEGMTSKVRKASATGIVVDATQVCQKLN